MRSPRRLAIRTLLIILISAVAAGASSLATAAEKRLRIGISQFPANFHPYIQSMLAKSYLTMMTQPPLVHYDHQWQLACKVCLTLPSLDDGSAKLVRTADGSQGMAVTYKIHPEATWGDGTPVTTKDVLLSWELGRHPLSGVANGEFFRRISKIEIQDNKTYTAYLNKVYFDYPARGALYPLPSHLEREIFQESPKKYRLKSTFETEPTHPGLAYGPYRIDRVERGAFIHLVRNDYWHGEKPYFDRIIVTAIENTAAMEANLLSGSIDMIAGELGLTLDQAIAFEKRHADRFNVTYKPGLIYEHIDLNLDNPILSDKRVRQALLYGVDRNALSTQLFAGKQPVAHSNVNPLDWVQSENVTRYQFDPARAGKLLDAAGWSSKRRGIRHNAKGEPLALEFMTTAGNRSRELVQQVLQNQWKQIGINVTIRNEPPRVYFGETVRKRKFSAMAMFAWISSPESVPRTTLHSEMIPSEANNYSGQNATGFKHARVDKLIDAIETELDRPKRKALWAELQQIYAQELPALPLYWRANAHITPKWLKGVRPTGHQFSSSLWVEQWRR